MKINAIRHVEFEGMGMIRDWADERGHEVTETHLWKDFRFENIGNSDVLMIFGGPMGIYDYKNYPWLKEEKEYIKQSVFSGKKVLGVCLGAQLLADVLGGKVVKNEHKEIGWHAVQGTFKAHAYFPGITRMQPQTVFHWHGDKFEIPERCERVFQSEGCENQGFVSSDGQVVGLQFHFEMGKENVEDLLKNCKNELKERGRYIQSAEKIREGFEVHSTKNRELLFGFLDSFLG